MRFVWEAIVLIVVVYLLIRFVGPQLSIAGWALRGAARKTKAEEQAARAAALSEETMDRRAGDRRDGGGAA